MRQKHLPLMLTLSLMTLTACQPVPLIPTENRSSAPPGTRPSPTKSSQPLVPITSPQPSVAAPDTPVPVTPPLPEDARLELSLPIRFFDTPGQQTQIRVRLLDAHGQEIPLDGRKWLFGNSRPQDFSLSETGLLTALNDSGFTEINVQLAGTNLSATQTVSVNGVTTFVSGGGAAPVPSASPSPKPTALPLEQVTATLQFEGLNHGQFEVGSYWGEYQSNATIAIAANRTGNFILVWQNSLTHLIAQRYQANGLPQGAPFTVSTSGNEPQVALNNDGHSVITWIQDGHVYARRFDPDGNPKEAEFKVYDYSNGFNMVSDVAIDNDGHFVIVWSKGTTISFDVYARRFEATGIPTGPEFRVNTQLTGIEGKPAIAMNNTGHFVLIWQQKNDIDLYIYGQQYSQSGNPVGEAFKINTEPLNTQQFAAVAIDEDGNFIVVWKKQVDQTEVVYAQRYFSNGNPAGPELEVSNKLNTGRPEITGHEQHMQVAMSSTGDFTVSWVSMTRDQPAFNIYARRFTREGNPRGSAFQVNTLTSDAETQQVLATDSLGNLIIAWRRETPTELKFYAKRYRADGQTQ